MNGSYRYLRNVLWLLEGIIWHFRESSIHRRVDRNNSDSNVVSKESRFIYDRAICAVRRPQECNNAVIPDNR